MEQHFTLIMFLWAVGTVVFGSGVSWATVKLTQRNFEKRLDERDDRSKVRDLAIRGLEQRITSDEQAYVKVSVCEKDRALCDKEQTYHESVILARLSELKDDVANVIKEQKINKRELHEQLETIVKDLRAVEIAMVGKNG